MLIVKLFVDIEMFAMYNFIQKEGDTLSLGERIRKVRRTLDLTQEAFCNRIGLKRNSISLVESDKRNISDQAILSICREFNVDYIWLTTEQGKMFVENDNEFRKKIDRIMTSEDDTRKILFKSLVDASDDDIATIKKFIKNTAALFDDKKEKTDSLSD